MADLNSLIAQGFQFKEPPDPFAQYAQMQQLQRGEETGRMNQLLMQEKQRGFQEQNALRGVVSRPGFDPMNPTHAAEAHAAAPTLAPKYLEQVLTTRESRGKITAADIKAKSDREGMLAQAGRDMAQRPDNENIVSHNRDVQGSDLFTPDEKARVQARADMLLALPMDQRAAAIGNPGASAADMGPKVVAPGASLVRFGADKPYFTAPAAPTKTIGNVSPGDFTPASLAKFNASGNYGDLVPKPVKSAGDGTDVAKAPSGYRITKTGDLEAIPGGPAADKGLKPLTELQTIKLRTDVAKDYKTATTTLSQMDDLLESIDRVKTAPGLSAAAGYTGKLPSFPGGAAAQAETRLANLRGKVTALGKSLASATGAIGSIANQEWKILADQVANLDEVKGAGPLLEQISLIEAQTAGAIARIRDQYEKTRSEDFERFPQFRDLPAPKKPGSAPGKPAAHPPDIQAIIDAQKGK